MRFSSFKEYGALLARRALRRLGGGGGGGDDHDGAADVDGLADVGAVVEVGAAELVLEDLNARVDEDGLGGAAGVALVVFDLDVGYPGALGAAGEERDG